MLQRLDDVRFDRIFEKRRHCACRVQIFRRDRIPVKVICHDDPGQTLFQIRKIIRQTEDCHDLGCHRDHEMILPHHSVHLVAEADNNIAEHAVVHIQAAFPHNLSGIDPQSIALLDMVVKHGRQQIVGGSDGMEITGKMKIQIFHWNDLCVSAARRASLDAEAGPERGFTKGNQRLFIQFCHCLSETHGCRRLSLSGRSRIDRCDKHKLSVFIIFYLVPQFIGKFCLILSVILQVLVFNADTCGNVPDVLQRCLLSDLNIRLHFPLSFSDESIYILPPVRSGCCSYIPQILPPSSAPSGALSPPPDRRRRHPPADP